MQRQLSFENGKLCSNTYYWFSRNLVKLINFSRDPYTGLSSIKWWIVVWLWNHLVLKTSPENRTRKWPLWGIYMCRSYIRLVPQPEKDRDQNGKRHAKPKFDNSYLIRGAIRQASNEYNLQYNWLMCIQFITKCITCHSVCAYFKISIDK